MLKQQARTDTYQKKKQGFKKLAKPTIYALSAAFVVVIGLIGLNLTYAALFPNKASIVDPPKKNIDIEIENKPKQLKFSDIEIKEILSHQNFLNSTENSFEIIFKDEPLTIITSLNIELQNFLIQKLERLKKLGRGKPQQIAMVVLEPCSGKILALAGFDLLNPETNPCFNSDFPAASIFKIITAAAAVEELGFTPQTPLYFNGSKYTLYKRQLKDIKNKYTAKISFANAFAESVNPVFGKIGQNRLGNTILESYGNKFNFNQDIESELLLEPSRLEITDSPYKWAEIGCGFNHSTTISPIFAAMISSTIVNNGKKAAPSIIEKIVDSKNDIIYDKKNTSVSEVIKKDTAIVMQSLMQKTIKAGTVRKTFKGYNQDKILSKLVIGGKTGSIYNKEHTIKYDWFTGFAKQKNETAETKKNKIAVSIIVGHGDFIGTRAGKYGKMIIKEYYKNI